MRFLISSALKDDNVSLFFWSLGSELKARGHQVTFVTWGKRSGPKSYDLDGSVLWYPSYRPQHWRDVHFIYRLAKEKWVDCAIGTHVALNAVAAGSLMAGVPVRVGWAHTTSRAFLVHLGGWSCKTAFLLLRRRLVYGLLSHVVAVSGECGNDLRGFWHVPVQKIAVIHNAVRGGADKGTRGETRTNRLVYVGRLAKVKGVDTLMKAFCLVSEYGEVHLDVFGSGSERENLEKLVRELGIDQRVHFHGAIPQDEVCRAFAKADVAVVPSREEPFGLVVIEAMSVGTPIVASRVGGIPEILRDGVDGSLVPPEDPEALAAAIIRLLKDDALRLQMGRNARQRFLEEFQLSTRIPKVADWLEGLVEAAGR